MKKWEALKSPLVIAPTFNEAENIVAFVERVGRALPSAEILVVDDNSPDGTGIIADRLSAASTRVHVLHRPMKEGLGRAYVAGFEWALARTYDSVIQMDVDFSHSPEALPSLLEAGAVADIVLGSRYVRGGGTVGWPWRRKLISRFGSLYARALLQVTYHDLTGGFKLWRAAALRTINLSEVGSQGYAFQVEMTYRAHRAGAHIVEVPIVFEDRRAGSSKMSMTIAFEAMWRVFWIRFRV